MSSRAGLSEDPIEPFVDFVRSILARYERLLEGRLVVLSEVDCSKNR